MIRLKIPFVKHPIVEELFVKQYFVKKPFVKFGLINVNRKQINFYHVLSIETSCDDTCVALINRKNKNENIEIIRHERISLDNSNYGGIMPIKAIEQHHKNLAKITKEILKDFSNININICVTRGPGLAKSALSIGLEFAKGLSVGLNVPFIGVHHMLGHLLTCHINSNGKIPKFPFLTLLVSGGHTMLVLSESILIHKILINTIDIAVGDALDKCARHLLLNGNMLGYELDKFVQQGNDPIIQEMDKESIKNYHTTEDGLNFIKPFSDKKVCDSTLAFSFSAFESTMLKAILKQNVEITKIPSYIKRKLAKNIQLSIYGHIIERMQKYFIYKKSSLPVLSHINDLVISGGVASNSLLRDLLKEAFPQFKLHAPSKKLCTDNAVMIGWCGIQIFENYSLVSSLDCTPLKSWALDTIKDDIYWEKYKQAQTNNL